MRNSMRNVEARFNKKFGYPWVFMNDEPFDEEFKVGVRSMTRSEIHFGALSLRHRILDEATADLFSLCSSDPEAVLELSELDQQDSRRGRAAKDGE